MGMTIDEMYDWLYRLKSELVVYMPKEWHEPMRDSIQSAIVFSRKYQMMQAEYEARLKADMVAILTELQISIQELSGCSCECSDGIVDSVDDLIQERIDALGGGEECQK